MRFKKIPDKDRSKDANLSYLLVSYLIFYKRYETLIYTKVLKYYKYTNTNILQKKTLVKFFVTNIKEKTKQNKTKKKQIKVEKKFN